MRVPLSWLRDFVDVDLSAEDLADLITVRITEVDAVVRPTAGIRDVVVARVESVARIEGSDKLSHVVATDGTDTLDVVCGASNFAAGDRVAWAKPGSVLPGGLEIGRRTMFGVTSNGMLASARELGVGDDHSGIWVLESDAPLGADVNEWLGLDDAVLVLEVTPDRGYALSLHGLARDLAAITGATLRVPDLGDATASAAPAYPGEDPVPVTISDPDRCRRFDARVIRDVSVGPSPAWLQRRLAAAGMRPVSNLVDATNAAMLETGNPIHAYDLRLLAGPVIDVRTARPGERLRTLDGVDRELVADDLVICDADGPVALAGVMGGEATEINDATRDVFLEVANFVPWTVLRTARRHGLPTEGSKRWERGVPPESAPVAAARCVELLQATAGGQLEGGADHYPTPPERPVIRLRHSRANDHLGLALTAEAQAALLQSIGCSVTAEDGASRVDPPAYRPDLVDEVDLYEEIVRLHGYERVPQRVPSSGQVGGRAPDHAARIAVRRALAGGGWTEVMPFPFIADADLEALQLPADDRRRRTIALVNPLSKEEAVLRTTLLPGLLRVVRHNVNRQVTDAAVFEIGHLFLQPTSDEPGAPAGPGEDVALPAEPLSLGFAACGAFDHPRHDRPARPVDVYDVLGAVELVRHAVGADALTVEATDEAPLHPGRGARLSLEGEAIGTVGELHPRVAETFGVPARTVVGEIRLEPLVRHGIRFRPAITPSPLPGARFDVAVIVEASVPAGAVEQAVRDAAGARVTSCRLFDVFSGAQIGEGNVSLAYALQLDDSARQLTDADVAEAIERIAGTVAERFGGRLRR
ncbi:MAG TPA: phenylalanine--tRNA ligase subunit beta [Egibacteraceae bacterium]|nr:phenylalanine--tRNA ligase subunit beta [Egibacteraceae bacterium]